WPRTATHWRPSRHLTIQFPREWLPRLAECKRVRRTRAPRPRAALILRCRSRWPRGFSNRCPKDAIKKKLRQKIYFWNLLPRGRKLHLKPSPETPATAPAESLPTLQRQSAAAA